MRWAGHVAHMEEKRNAYRVKKKGKAIPVTGREGP
jgi:hypothetical protein